MLVPADPASEKRGGADVHSWSALAHSCSVLWIEKTEGKGKIQGRNKESREKVISIHPCTAGEYFKSDEMKKYSRVFLCRITTSLLNLRI